MAERCVCGAVAELVSWTVQRVGERRHEYHRCTVCGSEWTLTTRVVDLADPVTTDEVIEVHELLEGDELRVEDLVEG